ncbi:DUF3168 domain-containing protein [Paracoccus onubensis]|uniref:DUF3168 domain-containing protein n=1 Tax=Paracoccus onubensis TaxID=1675788 RepID=A0A418T421_9RHOB|nr:DUF3168 domain-containing protein [Paracoccus onubensis]RJE87962.1 DUF3168 domain-containing protein [Paracoccus onubensis]
MKAGRKLRQIIMDRIIAEVPDLAGQVYDKATKGDAYPYATMGPSYWRDVSVTCIESRAQTVQVDIWHSKESKGLLEDLTDEVADALRGWADPESLRMHPAQISLVRVMDDPDGVSAHGVVQVEVRLERS